MKDRYGNGWEKEVVKETGASTKFIICCKGGYIANPKSPICAPHRHMAYEFPSLEDAEEALNKLFPSEIDQKGMMIVGVQ